MLVVQPRLRDKVPSICSELTSERAQGRYGYYVLRTLIAYTDGKVKNEIYLGGNDLLFY